MERQERRVARDIGDRRMAISGAARNHHRSSLDPFAVVNLQRQRPVRARTIERLDGDGYHHFGAEFLRLDEGPGSQGLA